MPSLGLHSTCPGLLTSWTAPFSRYHMSLCFGPNKKPTIYSLMEQKSGARGLPQLLFATSGPVPDRSRTQRCKRTFQGQTGAQNLEQIHFSSVCFAKSVLHECDRAEVGNCGPWTNSGHDACLLNKVYWRYSHTHLFAYCPWLFAIQQHNGTATPESLKICNYLLSRLLPKHWWIPEKEK